MCGNPTLEKGFSVASSSKDGVEKQDIKSQTSDHSDQSSESIIPLNRRAHKKSRNGCTNCKIRRLKCDESKPHCLNCLKSVRPKLLCEYSNGRKPRSPGVRSRPPVLVPKEYSGVISKPVSPAGEVASPASLIKPLDSLFQSQEDFQYFTFFRTKTARNLSGFFDDEIWDRLILQACHQEEFARHAVVAIAALHKTTIIPLASSPPQLGSQTTQDHHTYALQKYSKALKLMRLRIGNMSHTTANEHQLRVALISSLLTTCFENFHGNHHAAISQASTGLRLLFSVRERTSSPTSPRVGNSVIDRDLLSIFARLELGAVTITHEEIFPQDDTVKGREDEAVLASMPSVFETLREARFYWDTIVRQSISWRASYGYSLYEPHKNKRDKTRDKPESQPKNLKEAELLRQSGSKNINVAALIGTPVPPYRQKRLEAQLTAYWEVYHRWCAAFTPIYERACKSDKRGVEWQGAQILWLGSQASGLNSALRNPKVPDEVSASILRVVAEILWWEGVARRESLKDDGAEGEEACVFLFDPCLLHHLFIVATRTQDRVVKREAIDMLKKCKRREGALDSAFVARMAEWIAELDAKEDEGKEDAGRRKARLIVTDENFDFENRRAWVRCRKLDFEGEYTPIMGLRW